MFKNLNDSFKIRVLMISLFCLIVHSGWSQTKHLITQIEAGGIRGIQISKTFPVLKTGTMAQISLSKPFGQFVQAGIGIGYIQLEREDFKPLFFYIKGNKKHHENSMFFESSLGISKGTNYDFINSNNTEFNGGIYFSPGIGYQYIINSKIALTSNINYVLQKATLNQLNSFQEIFYSESLSLDLIIFKIGLTLK